MVFVACSERDATGPRVPGGARFAQALVPATTCDFTQVNKAAGAYFSSKQDPVYALLTSMKQAGGGSAAATSIGWDVLRRVAAARLSSATGAASDGAVFVNDVLRCTTYSFPPTASSDVQQKFLDNLSLVLSAGIFNVRGGAGDPTDPAAALDGSPRVLALPHWGVEPVTAWAAGPYLVWGYPVLIGGALANPATLINTNGTGTYNGFELGTIPNGQSKTGLRVGVCYQSTTGGNTANRLIHNNSEILVNNTPGALCSMTQASLSLLNAPWYTRALAGAASFVTPKSAFAFQGGDQIGGLPSSWSPFLAGALLGADISLTFTTQPNDAVVGGNVHSVVNATFNGAPVPGVDITISIDNNSGVPAGAVITSGNTTVTTDAQGNAVFDITIGKPGGYLLAANGSLTGVTTGSTISGGATLVAFHIKQP